MKLALLVPRASAIARRFPSGGDFYDAQLALALERRGHTVEVLPTPPELDVRAWSDRLSARGYAAVLQDELGHAQYLRLNRRLRQESPRARLIALVHVTRARLEPEAKSIGLERQFLRSVESALFVSRQVRRETERLLGVRVASRVAHPGCDHLPRALASRPSLQRMAAGRVRFVCAGHLLPNKGQLELLEAFATVRGRYTLALAGDPARDRRYAAKVRRAAAELGPKVRLLGPLTQAQLVRAFARADAFVSASVYESYGIAAAEALAAGLPVVSWAEGGLWEFLSPGRDALRVKPRDRAGLASALAQLCADRALLQRLQRGARRSGRKLPRWDEAAMRLEQLLPSKRHAA